MDPWIHGSAAGAAARAAAGAGAGTAASAATYYVIIGGALRALFYLHDKVHTVAAEAAAPAAAPAAALAAAPAADPWIHGSISFVMNHIFYYEGKNISKNLTWWLARCILSPQAIVASRVRGPPTFMRV